MTQNIQTEKYNYYDTEYMTRKLKDEYQKWGTCDKWRGGILVYWRRCKHH
jgi:hypothetical protein